MNEDQIEKVLDAVEEIKGKVTRMKAYDEESRDALLDIKDLLEQQNSLLNTVITELRNIVAGQ